MVNWGSNGNGGFWSSSDGKGWGSWDSLGWNLPDGEFDISLHWDINFLFVVILSVSGFSTGSGGTSSSESLVDFAIWNLEFEAETGFNPVNWGDGVEVHEV